MVKTILAVCFVFLLTSSALFAYSGNGGHDSLLFDGSGISSIAGDEYICRISVEKVQGKVTGTRMVDKMVTECGGDPQKMVEYKKEQIQTGDFLKPGDEISAGPDGTATITLIDGKEIYIYSNTIFTVGNSYDYCKNEDIPVSVKKGGRLLIDARKGDRNKVLEIQTDRSKVYVKGTVFAVITEEDNSGIDIIKTYEGTVEVYVNKKDGKEVGDKAAEIQKLYEDYQNKKITNEEFTAKMIELQSQVEKGIDELNKIKLSLTAGFKCTVDSNGKLTDPETFDTNDDPNFKK